MKGTEAWDDGNTSNEDEWNSNQMWRRIHQDFYIIEVLGQMLLKRGS